MRVLVVGGGGREHALVWKIAQSPLVEKIYCAPGNAGIAQLAECVPIEATDIAGLADFAERNGIRLTVVGPEAPLIAGIVDRFEARGLPIFGPSTDPARLEGSKTFAKELMQSAGIPTAAFWTCRSLTEAQAILRAYYTHNSPDVGIVIKADGIAAGKGVIVADSQAEAEAGLIRIMGERVFGAAGDVVVIEERLYGEEASIMAITDGDTIVPLVPSQDHKRIGDGDTVPIIPSDTASLAMERILRPAIRAIRELGIPYRGVLYAGIIVTSEGPKCIEFNCRLGDPETQAVLPLLSSDLVALLLGVTDCTLDKQEVRWRGGASATVVAASGGYPDHYETGRPITGLDTFPKQDAEQDSCLVFHAGTRLSADGQVVTDGGRVLSVTGLAEDLNTAVARAYAGLSRLHFDGITYRRDIAARALQSNP